MTSYVKEPHKVCDDMNLNMCFSWKKVEMTSTFASFFVNEITELLIQQQNASKNLSWDNAAFSKHHWRIYPHFSISTTKSTFKCRKSVVSHLPVLLHTFRNHSGNFPCICRGCRGSRVEAGAEDQKTAVVLVHSHYHILFRNPIRTFPTEPDYKVEEKIITT